MPARFDVRQVAQGSAHDGSQRTGRHDGVVGLDENGVDLLGNTIEDFSVSLDGEEIALDENGEATFLYVVPGTLTLDLVEPAGFTATTSPVLPTGVAIAEQEVKDVLITLTGLTGP